MKKLMIVLFLIGGILMINPMDAFLKNNIGNIIHRKNLTTGIVRVVNPNNSFDVEIGNSGKIRKEVFTLSPDPDLAVEDKVRIGYLKGSLEDPIIFAPTKPAITIIRRYGLIVAYPNELQIFDMAGSLLKQISVAGWAYSGCDITLDADGNIYTEIAWSELNKYDSNGVLLVTQPKEGGDNWFESMNIGPDGYLYTLEGRASGYAIAKRDLSDLTIIEDVVTLATGYYGGGICLDSSGNFYIYSLSADKIEKWNSAGAKVAELSVGSINEYAGFGICGSNLYISDTSSRIYYMPLDLSSYSEWNLGVSIAYALTVADGHLILSGWGTGGDGATRKYDSSRNLIWETFLGGSTYGYKAGGYNF